MAKLLYRLGRGSANRPWFVIIGWLLVLAITVTAFFAFSGRLNESVSIPGTETERVTDELAEALPEAADGVGRVVLVSDSGEFNQEQRDGIALTLSKVSEVEGVTGTLDPFVTQAQLEGKAAELAEKQRQLDTAEEQLTAGKQQLDAAEQQLAAAEAQHAEGNKQLADAITQATAGGLNPNELTQILALRTQLEEAGTALEQQRTQLDTAKQQLTDSELELATGKQKIAAANSLLEYAGEIRLVSEDSTAALASVMVRGELHEANPNLKEHIINAFNDNLPAGVTAEFSAQITQEVPSVLGSGELVGLALALLVMLILMRAIIPATIPIATAVTGVAIGVTATLSLSGVVDMMSVTPILGVMLGLAVGIDYSLFIINRHRKQLRRGTEVYESIGLANGTSGNAVVFAGITVIIALLGLNVTGVPFLATMGTVAAFCVLVAVLLAVTLVPALLGLAKMRALSRRERQRLDEQNPAEREAALQKAAERASAIRPMPTWRAIITAVAAVALLVTVAIPAAGMRLGFPTGKEEPIDSTAYRAYMIVDEKFGEGANGQLLAVAKLPAPEAAAGEDPATSEATLSAQASVAGEIFEQDGVRAVAPIGVSEDGTVAAFQVIPDSGPDTAETTELVHTLRQLEPAEADGVLGVAGNTSAVIDVAQKLQDSLSVYLLLVVGMSLLILIIVFRSILVPLLATGGFVLSLLATYGAITAIYQNGFLAELFGVHEPAPILAFLPTLVLGILFGLAMDYQLFIGSGMREAYAHGEEARHAVQHGLLAGRAVVIAAALIMIAVFGSFIFSESNMVRPIGFGLAFGVLIDAFIVRLLLLPAIMHLLGKSAWWIPRWLDRILPNFDVEGASLEREHAKPAAQVGEADPLTSK